MAEIKIKKADGTDGGVLNVKDEVFGIEPNAMAVRATLDNYMAGQRRGTHSTKTRGMVSGGGKKPWKQKHTGRARQGSIRAAQWRHGAIVFGPSPRDYSYRINKKVRQSAYRSILSDFAREGRIIAIDDFGIGAPKTKDFVRLLDGLGAEGKVLLFTEPGDTLLLKSARNIPYVNCVSVESPNIFDLLTHDYLIARSSVIKRLEGVYA